MAMTEQENAKIFKLEEENKVLKLKLHEETQLRMQIWERDFMITSQISDFLEKPGFDSNKSVIKLFSDIKHSLFAHTSQLSVVDKNEIKSLKNILNEAKKEISIITQKHRDALIENERNKQNVEELMNKIKKLENENKKQTIDIQELNSQKYNLLFQKDKFFEEKEFQKYRMKELEQMIQTLQQMSNKSNNNEPELDNKIIKLEALLAKKNLEIGSLWEKMEFFRKMANM